MKDVCLSSSQRVCTICSYVRSNGFSLPLNKTSICVILAHCLVSIFRGLVHTNGTIGANFMPFFMMRLCESICLVSKSNKDIPCCVLSNYISN